MQGVPPSAPARRWPGRWACFQRSRSSGFSDTRPDRCLAARRALAPRRPTRKWPHLPGEIHLCQRGVDPLVQRRLRRCRPLVALHPELVLLHTAFSSLEDASLYLPSRRHCGFFHRLARLHSMSGNISLSKVTLTLFLAATLTADASPTSPEQSHPAVAAKITFRLDDIRPDGLRGPVDGLRSVAYELCVPANERAYEEVKRIDPSVGVPPGSRGRIGCGKDQTLCVGSTHQPRWREVLKRLSSLPYIAEIRECFFE